MKKTIFAAALLIAASAFADGDSSQGQLSAEEIQARGGLTTVVGGCENARAVGVGGGESGSTVEIEYSGNCNVQAVAPDRYHRPVTEIVFPTYELAAAHCTAAGWVQAAYGWNNGRLAVIGYACAAGMPTLPTDNGQ